MKFLVRIFRHQQGLFVNRILNVDLSPKNFLFGVALSFGAFFLCDVAKADAEWTVLIYAQANNSLGHFAYKSFNDMASVGSDKELNVLVQWYKFGEHGTFRYKIEKEKMQLDQCISTPTDGNKVEDLVGAMQWAVTKYPAKKYCLVLWNHGIGILDPAWGHSAMMAVNPNFFKDNPRIQIEDLTLQALETEDSTHPQLAEGYPYRADFYRGILFNERSRTYMNNQVLSQALSKIKTNILNNKKIDILGMDACLMAMIEVGYQIKDYANYMVGSQEVELAYGWDYKSILQALSGQKLSPLEVVESIILTYKELYKKQIQFYTQSAFDLEKIALLKDSIDEVVRNMLVCYELDKKGFSGVLKNARNKCLRFSTPTYVDLQSFFQELLYQSQLAYHDNKKIKKIPQLKQSLEFLQQAIMIGQAAIKDTVVASVAGSYYNRASGLSIYFPVQSINNSYEKTEFAKDSLWHDFLKKIIYW
ncbi:MAG: clostripain-related cysteine peptidase [bacterium]